MREDVLVTGVELGSEIVEEGTEERAERGFGAVEVDFVLNVGDGEEAQ